LNAPFSIETGNGKPPAPEAATVAIASISDQDWYVSRTYGVFHIPACAKGQPYSLLLLTARGDAIDLGDSRKFPFRISAPEIAADLVQDLASHGVFVCAGPRPTDEELARAIALRDAWYQQLVFEGDQMWARSHNYRELSDMHRRAALALGLEREWAYVPTKMVDCPVCGEKVKEGVAICRHCTAVLNPQKARQHGFAQGRQPASEMAGVQAPATDSQPQAVTNQARRATEKKAPDSH
jgi:hypothetical protein